LTEIGSKLNVPIVDDRQFSRNFLASVVCELRFPTILELERESPLALRKALKSSYPIYEKSKSVSLEPNRATVSEVDMKHNFVSRDRDWKVLLGSSSIALETTNYQNFANFLKKFKVVIWEAKDLLDTDFYTRVGLRYVNTIPIDDEDANNVVGWVNDRLVGAFADGIFGDAISFNTEITGFSTIGGFTIRHGIGRKKRKDLGFNSYFLDFDHYLENVDAGDLVKLLEAFHKVNFSLFYWCLGPKSKEKLEAS